MGQGTQTTADKPIISRSITSQAGWDSNNVSFGKPGRPTAPGSSTAFDF